MTGTARILLLLICGLAATGSAGAHEVRPAYLKIVERDDDSIEIRWRQPVMGDYTIAIAPVLSSGWLDGEPQERSVTSNSLVKTWSMNPPHAPLAGQTLWIKGLNRTITDTLVRIEYADGRVLSHLVKASRPSMEIPAKNSSTMTVPEYLLLGIHHIWSGPDHLIYVLGLILLISTFRSLITTITAFTLAHSLTLACAALGWIQLRPAPVEAVISLSIVYVAVELLRLRRGESSLAGRAPWMIAFVFGLLHGFGFAGALRETGLPDQAIAPALFMFNVGIELGQIMFVLLILATFRFLRNYLPVLQERMLRIAPYGIGSVASFWLIERMTAIF